MHKQEVSAVGNFFDLALHPDRTRIASGDLGHDPVIYIWSSKTLAMEF
jgi:hypothetical protein